MVNCKEVFSRQFRGSITITPQEIQKRVAEECGWHVEVDDDQFWRATDANGNRTGNLWCSQDAAIRDFPDFTTSLEAIQRAAFDRFKGLDAARFDINLLDPMKFSEEKYIWQLTALDWCEAFLQTCEQLKEIKK